MSQKEIKTTWDLLNYGRLILKENNIESFLIDSRILLSFVTGYDEVKLNINMNEVISFDKIKNYLALIARRKNGEPIKYLVNYCEFMGLSFYVDKKVLIPRNDTEILVETSIKEIHNNNFKKILEIGTGSGCISISLKHFLNYLNITACDISEDALEIAKKNAKNNDVSINFVKSDIFSNLVKSSYDMIISNPPYIKTNTINTLSKDVKDFEPFLALDGGYDGLDFYRKIIEQSKDYLWENGMLIFEIGHDQGNSIKDILIENNFKEIEILKDYAGKQRVCKSKRIGE